MAKAKSSETNIIGGGPKKVLYTLNTARKIGLKNTSKALTANNTCKACGLGMGGQKGGMTNELGEYPAVCNKSLQAQSTDIQAPIPEQIFNHSLDELKELSAYELEHLGRLNTPVYKAKGDNRYKPVSWDWALDHAAKRFAETVPDRSFFYSSGRSSNEAGFVLQLLARLYGTNNINNCSYYCQQASSEALTTTLGTATSTIGLEDLNHCDTVFVIGANPSSNHPRLIHKLKGVRDRGGNVVIINPAKEPGLVRFAVPKSAKSMLSGGTYIASEYLQPNIGGDVALFKGLAKALLDSDSVDQSFIDKHTQDFAAFKADIGATTWQSIESTSGIKQTDIERIAKLYGSSKQTVFCWGMGMTHHSHGVVNIEYIINLAMMRGMVGKTGAGLLPLRGHSNVQGIGTIGVKPVLAADVFKGLEQHYQVKLPTSQGMDTLACLEAADNQAIDAALLMGGNLYAGSPHSAWVAGALNNIAFKVFLTTTLNSGHLYGVEAQESLVLPVTARDEEWQPTTQESMFNYVRLSDGGISRHDNTRPETVVLSDLASRLLVNCPVDFQQFKQHATTRETIAHIVPGMAQLKGIDETKQEFHIEGRLRHQPVFNTADGRGRFQVHPLPKSLSEEAYPFTLMSVRSEGQFNSIIYEEHDSYRNTQERWSVLMSEKTIKRLGVQNGWVNLVSEYGRMDHVKVYPFDLPENNLMAYYPEANVLIGLNRDKRSQTPAFKSVAVQIETV